MIQTSVYTELFYHIASLHRRVQEIHFPNIVCICYFNSGSYNVLDVCWYMWYVIKYVCVCLKKQTTGFEAVRCMRPSAMTHTNTRAHLRAAAYSFHTIVFTNCWH